MMSPASRDLSQDLDVKVDTKEPRSRLTGDFPNAKNWTKFHVKIEAIQCFPCYVKVTLMRNSRTSTAAGTNPLIVRITIPGLHVQLAASRTKAHCYGLFWKSNRKRCSIFLAFATEQDRCTHMAWMKDSIKELEQYRQDFLEIRRASRCSAEIIDQGVRLTDVFSNYQNLGPLPPVPVESSLEWSRRQSAVSGIYEEIPEAEAISVAPRSEREPAENKNNGIYERLYRRRSNTVTQSLLARTPPPLPPRQRINTLDRDGYGSAASSLVSSPDSDTLKKRKYKTVLESIFGKPASTSTVGSRKGSESSSGDVEEVRARFNADLLSHLETNLGKNKRNSFSTPELANWDEDEGDGGRLNRLQENDHEEEEEDATEWQDLSCTSLISESMDISVELNISDKIKPNFNLSMNTSTINLVGCNFNAIRESEIGLREDEKRQSLHQLNGYCVMKPIPSIVASEEEGVHVLPGEVIPRKTSQLIKEDAKSAGYCQMGAMGFDREQLRKLDQPVRGIVFNEDARGKLFDMKNITMTRGSCSDEVDAEEESFLRRKTNPTPPKKDHKETTSRDEDLYENCRDNRNSRGSKYLVDDKIPSYFPNESPPNAATLITPPKLVPKQRSRASMTPSPRLQNYSPRAVPNIYSVPRNNSPVLMDSAKDTEMLKQSLTDSISKLSLISNSPQSDSGLSTPVKSGREGSPQKTTTTPDKKKFDTIQSPNKYLDKCSLKADFANLKRFASLPRFRKLDLSPLRIKLNSVLHRHNSEF